MQIEMLGGERYGDDEAINNYCGKIAHWCLQKYGLQLKNFTKTRFLYEYTNRPF